MKKIWFLLSTLLLSAAFVLVSSAGDIFQMELYLNQDNGL